MPTRRNGPRFEFRSRHRFVVTAAFGAVRSVLASPAPDDPTGREAIATVAATPALPLPSEVRPTTAETRTRDRPLHSAPRSAEISVGLGARRTFRGRLQPADVVGREETAVHRSGSTAGIAARSAEGVGFEPTVPGYRHDGFETAPVDHSAIHPTRRPSGKAAISQKLPRLASELDQKERARGACAHTALILHAVAKDAGPRLQTAPRQEPH
jgi:hypothetical protein